MPIKITRISIVNCDVDIPDLTNITELKQELADRLKVKTSDIHFNYTEQES